jgi:prepilin-type N-terminal cleavage/methylation domain-containing protein
MKILKPFTNLLVIKDMRKSFTLIELMVVIGIVALLSTIGLTTYSSTQQNARNTRRKTDLKTIESALNSYYSINGRYPNTCNTAVSTCAYAQTTWWGTCTGYGSHSTSDADGNAYITGLAPAFMPKLPTDPRDNLTNTTSTFSTCRTSSGSNCYLFRSTGTDFKLLAHCAPEGTLEDTDPFYDPARDSVANGKWAWQVSSSATSANW